MNCYCKKHLDKTNREGRDNFMIVSNIKNVIGRLKNFSLGAELLEGFYILTNETVAQDEVSQ